MSLRMSESEFAKLGKAPRRSSNEGGVLAACLAYLHAKGIFCWRNNTQGTYDAKKGIWRKNKAMLKGVSDILGVLPDGRFLAVECKDLSKLSLDQRHFLERVKAAGGVAIVAKSIDDLKEAGL